MSNSSTNVLEIQAQRDAYFSAGYDAIPIVPRGKRPFCPGWQTISAKEQWAGVPWDCNLGLRLGGSSKLAVIDADDKNAPGTADRVRNLLVAYWGKRHEICEIATASQIGRQFPFILIGELSGNWINLRNGMAGELRYGAGAQVVAFPSVVGGVKYKLISGSIFSPGELPIDIVLDLFDLAKPGSPFQPDNSSSLPAEGEEPLKAKKYISPFDYSKDQKERLVAKGFTKLNMAIQQPGVDRSVEEQRLMTSLAAKGMAYEEMKGLFIKHEVSSGKFIERYSHDPKDGDNYLRHSYNKAVGYLEHSDTFKRLFVAWAAAYVRWPGRKGLQLRAVFLAHVKIAFQTGHFPGANQNDVYHASTRDLSTFSGVHRNTIERVSRELVCQGYIDCVETASGAKANKFRLLVPDLLRNIENSTNDNTELVPFLQRVAGGVFERMALFASHDAFRQGALGRGCQQMLELMEPGVGYTDVQLSNMTGRTRRAIKGYLKRLGELRDPQSGEPLNFIQEDKGMFRAGKIDSNKLDIVAEMFGTKGLGAKRLDDYTRERINYRNRKTEKFTGRNPIDDTSAEVD